MSEHRTVPSMEWSDHGACTNADPDLFFPSTASDTTYARSICRACPVRAACLDYALETSQKHGIWGGMTEGQRRRLKRNNHPSQPQPVVQPEVKPDKEPARHLHLVH